MTEIKKLTDFQHARLRTEMYLGSRAPHTQTILDYNNGLSLKELTWVPACYTGFREILDNALDEVIGHGYGNKIDVKYDEATGIISISDNGRGIPIDWDDEHQCHKATLALTEARAGRNFGVRGAVAGTNGIGSSAVNFCSEHFKVEIHRDGKKFEQTFSEGIGEQLIIDQPKITKSQNKTGTIVTFKLSNKVFPQIILPGEFIQSRLFEIAAINQNIKLSFNGNLIRTKPKLEQTLFSGYKPILIEINEDNFNSKFWLVPSWSDHSEYTHTIVNNIPAFNGGIHMESFRRLFYGNLLNALEKEAKKRKLSPNRTDLTEGILLFNITNMNAPNFDSQSKTRLINEEVGNILKRKLDNPDLYKEIIRKNKEWIDQIFQRCAERTQKKDAADIARAAKKLLRTKVPGLMDATSNNRKECILFLGEGLSAIGGVGAVRNPDIHGGLGLRGKVLNVNGENPKKVLENSALADIMNSMGLIIGSKAKREALRYGKIYIAADMDPDGFNISALLINFFHTYWPELFDQTKEPLIYIFMTPFIIAKKQKQTKYWYAYNYNDFDSSIYNKATGWTVIRAKGLGTLTEEDWKYSLDNPVVYPVVDDGKLHESLDLIFNSKRADDRKTWIGI